ncbi:MAG: ribulose phosphate epimerase [Nannocystaceae bacterium]|nr:ribulose phosphate epimerase [Nannocystaceae bacterium]
MRRLGLGSLSLLCISLAGCPADSTPADTDGASSGADGTMTTTATPTTVDPSATGNNPGSTSDDPSVTPADSSDTGGAPGTTGSPAGPMLCQPQEGPVVVGTQTVFVGGPPAGDVDGIGLDPQGGGTGDFITVPDGGPVGNECDVWDQDCPDGEKCNAWANDGGGSWNALRCVEIAPDPGQPGEECTVIGNGVSGADDCDVSVMCLNVDSETNMGICVEMCKGNAEAPVCNTPNTTCTISNDGVLVLCRPLCNPLANECPAGQACYPVGDAMVCAFDASAEGGLAGDPCASINACDSGHFCASPRAVPGCDGTGCCSPFCTIGDASNCLPEQTCQAWYPAGEAPAECLAEVGACLL